MYFQGRYKCQWRDSSLGRVAGKVTCGSVLGRADARVCWAQCLGCGKPAPEGCKLSQGVGGRNEMAPGIRNGAAMHPLFLFPALSLQCRKTLEKSDVTSPVWWMWSKLACLRFLATTVTCTSEITWVNSSLLKFLKGFLPVGIVLQPYNQLRWCHRGRGFHQHKSRVWNLFQERYAGLLGRRPS